MYSLFHSYRNTTFLWKKFPFLLASLYYSLGILCYFHTGLAILLFILLSPVWIQSNANNWYRYAIMSIFIMLFGILLTRWKIDLPELTEVSLYGSAWVHIHSVEKQTFFFGSGYVYRGIIKSFYSSLKDYHSIPCNIYTKDKIHSIDCDYFIRGELRKAKPFQFILKPTKRISWEPVPHTFSLAELRFRCKTVVQKFLKKRFPSRHIYSLISTLSTGTSPDLIVKHHFSRLGLSHLLVISGFHFSILTFFAKKILNFFSLIY